MEKKCASRFGMKIAVSVITICKWISIRVFSYDRSYFKNLIDPQQVINLRGS